MADSGPRRFVVEAQRELYGQARDIAWESPRPGEEAVLSAAYRQHLLAFAVRSARREQGWSMKQLADHVGMHGETLRRKLRGEAWLRWEDASVFALAFPGRQILPPANELLPRG